MQWKLNELRGKLADQGRPVALEAIATATGISRQTLTEISKGRLRVLRPEYVDALSTYFAHELGVTVDDIQIVRAEPVALPLDLNIRPDRAGRRVGEKAR